MDIATTTRHCPICDADVEMPADTLATMADMPKTISRTFREPRSLRGEGWTPHEIAAHLADVEIVLAWRIRQVLAEDEPMLQPFDQDVWAVAFHYSGKDLATSLSTYAANRQANIELLRSAGDAGMARKYRHPEFGTRPIRTFIEHISDHDLAHLRQIRGQ